MTLSRKRLVFMAMWVALTAAMAALPAGAQEALWQRVRGAYEPGAVDRIQAVVQEARSQQIPAEPLLEKALEGAAKSVPPDRVIPVLQEYAGRLGRTAGLLPPSPTKSGLVAGADALRRGVPPEAIREIAGENPQASPMSLVVLGDLVEADVPVEEAKSAIRQVMAREGGVMALLDLPAVVRSRIRAGEPPGQAARGAAAAGGGGPPPWAGGPPGLTPGAAPGKPPVPPGARGKGKGPPDNPGKGGKPGGGVV